MSYDHFKPPAHLSPTGRFLFRALCLVTVIIGMTAFAYFVAPLIYSHVSMPFGDWIYETVRQWTGEPPRAPRT